MKDTIISVVFLALGFAGVCGYKMAHDEGYKQGYIDAATGQPGYDLMTLKGQKEAGQ